MSSGSKRIRVKDKDLLIPSFSGLVHNFKYEALFTFGSYEQYPMCQRCFGIGRVVRIEKGDKFDIVKITFGRNTSRQLIVISNHARRQILTLKRGQYCIFLGHYRLAKSPFNQGEKIWMFYAHMLQGMYVPKMVDIRNYDGADLDTVEKEESLLNFLDQFGEQEK